MARTRAQDRKPAADAGEVLRFDLHADRRGAVWDLLLYVPTVVALASWGAMQWFGGEQALAYLLSFLASFFLLVGANRILKTRLLLLASAPVGVEVSGEVVTVLLRGGGRVELVKNQRLFADYSGRTFGLSGLDREGRRPQFVFHRGQFPLDGGFARVQDAIRTACPGAAKDAGARGKP